MKVKGREGKRGEQRKGSIVVPCLFQTYYLPCVTIILAHVLSLSEVNLCVSKAWPTVKPSINIEKMEWMIIHKQKWLHRGILSQYQSTK